MEMPSPFDFQVVAKNFSTDYSFCEPISVLDSRIPGGPTPSSTPSSSIGCGGGAASVDTAGAAAASDRNLSPKWQHDSTTATSSSGGGIDSELLPIPPSLADKCALEDWESVLSESAAGSPGQEQSSFRWSMGDVEDPAVLHKFLQFGGSSAAEFDFSGGFGVMDQAFAGENLGANLFSNFCNNTRSSSEKFDYASSNPIKFHQNSQNLMHSSPIAGNFGAISPHHPAAFESPAEMKPSIFINQHHAQNLSFFLPFSHAHENTAAPPPAKRLNSGGGQIRQQLDQQQQLQFPPHHLHHRPKTSGDGDLLRQAILEELYKAAELLQAGNPAPAQGILARLNQHLSPSGNPFHRAAFYCKEALQLLLHSTNPSAAAAHSSPLSLLFKVGAYKSFSEISPLVDFANFTCNQAFLEDVEGFDRIHIVDFDIGYGGQWASLMQELASSSNDAPQLKITALVSPSTHDQFELSLTRENLTQFANEIGIGLELEMMSIDSWNSSSLSVSMNEAVAVNLPVSCLTNHRLSATSALKLLKQLSPKIVVSIERGCDRRDLPLANHIIHGVEAYSALLDSIDAVSANVNPDALQKIEKLLIRPEMEKLVMSRFGAPEKWQQWRSVFMNCGFSPVRLSSFAESQAEMLVKRMGVEGFEVEKRQSSLVLCWNGKELLTVSVWR